MVHSCKVLNKINQILFLTLPLPVKMKLLVDHLGNIYFFIKGSYPR